MEHILELPPVATKLIEHYLSLNVDGKQIACPYYINIGHIKDLRVMVGKGSPDEIEMEVRIWAQLKGVELDKLTEDEIREFMRSRRIGIDCSGFLYHVLNTWLKSETGKGLLPCVKFRNNNPLVKLKRWLRPAENIGADILTSELNSDKINLQDIKPGDLVRSKSPKQNAHHVLLITRVGMEKNTPKWFEYTHSTMHYGDANGVRIGKVEITDVNGELKDQKWLEKDENGKCWTQEGLMINYGDNGLRRLRCLDKLELKTGNE